MSHELYDEKGLIYIPEPPRPSDFDQRFAEIVGVDGESGKPALRVVWCMDHREMFQGREEIRYIDPNGIYLGAPYYALEGWQPPSVYDREEWNADRYGAEVMVNGWPMWDAKIDALGPFPEEGVWDFLCFIRNDDMSFAPVEMALKRAREWKYNRERIGAKQRAASDLKEYLEKKARRKRAAMEEYKANQHAELEHWMNKEVPHSDNATVEVPSNYPTKKEWKTLRKQESTLLSGRAMLTESSVITPGGLIVKKSVLDN